MRAAEKMKNSTRNQDVQSLNEMNMNFLLDEAVDRSMFDTALRTIEPLSELEDLITAGSNEMPKTAKAIRDVIKSVNEAMSARPNPILSAIGLADPQRDLLNAITSAEVLKFSILNAMDAVRMMFITDFRKSNLKFFEDEVIVYNVTEQSAGVARISNPQRVSFTTVKEMGSYEIYMQGNSYMLIGPEASGAGLSATWSIPGLGSYTLNGVSAGKMYLVGRGSDGEPTPAPGGFKSLFLRVAQPANRGVLDKTIDFLATDPSRGNKTFDLNKIVKENLRVPSPVEGTIVSIYRAIRKKQAIQPPALDPSDLADDLKDITLDAFRKYFEALVEKTTNSTGDMSSYDIADTLVFGGLAAVSGMLGLTRPDSSGDPAPGSSRGADRGGGRGGSGTGDGGGAGGRGGRSHSFNNFMNSASIVKGSTPAERAANLSTVLGLIDRDSMRQELNRFVGPSVVFTEGAVDRWCELAGIKEGK